jgi:hypothetical protein
MDGCALISRGHNIAKVPYITSSYLKDPNTFVIYLTTKYTLLTSNPSVGDHCYNSFTSWPSHQMCVTNCKGKGKLVLVLKYECLKTYWNGGRHPRVNLGNRCMRESASHSSRFVTSKWAPHWTEGCVCHRAVWAQWWRTGRSLPLPGIEPRPST